ncbi:MAG: response regulator transcription factor [Xenococcaceae cyanobacterium MO_188.B29]|nr:response regulator transcription factor [Xenococcaceae cyanobacterium MO_188.B29]
MNRILIAEDNPRVAEFIEAGLQAQRYTTLVVRHGREVINIASSKNFELLILDLGLPDMDGMEVIREIRGCGETLPIIVLTARDGLNDKISGLEKGADDYITKPFRFEELLARIRVQLRKVNQPTVKVDNKLQIGDITLNLLTRQIWLGEKEIELSAREFILAETLARHPMQVMSRQQLLDHIWGYDYDPGSNIVDVYIGHLRKKLGNNLIETVRGIGYRLRP